MYSYTEQLAVPCAPQSGQLNIVNFQTLVLKNKWIPHTVVDGKRYNYPGSRKSPLECCSEFAQSLNNRYPCLVFLSLTCSPVPTLSWLLVRLDRVPGQCILIARTWASPGLKALGIVH